MKEDALELLMIAYQQTNNSAKMFDTAQKVLQANRATSGVGLGGVLQAGDGDRPNAQQSLTEAGQTSEKGLQCLQTASKPEGTSDADWQKLKSQTTESSITRPA